jgi:hypothetical protein
MWQAKLAAAQHLPSSFSSPALAKKSFMIIDLAKLAGAKRQFYMPEYCIVIKHFSYKEVA